MSLSRKTNELVRVVETITDRDTELTFGKYKGLTVGEVILYDPQYLLWAIDNLDWFDLDHKLMDEIENS